MSRNEVKLLGWPKNFLTELIGEKIDYPITTERLNRLEKSLYENIDERRLDMLLMYYRDFYTYAEIAKVYNLSTSRIRVLLVRVFQIMRRYSIMKQFLPSFIDDRFDSLEEMEEEERKNTPIENISKDSIPDDEKDEIIRRVIFN